MRQSGALLVPAALTLIGVVSVEYIAVVLLPVSAGEPDVAA